MLSGLFSRRTRREDKLLRDEVTRGIFRSAIGDLGPHESMLLALYCVSVIAGHVVQQVTLAKRIERGVPHDAPAVVPVTTSSGVTYVFGDAIAEALLGSEVNPGVVQWLADQAHLSRDERAVTLWFERSAKSLGSDDFGKPDPPFDQMNWPSIEDVIGNVEAVVDYLRSGGLEPMQFEPMLTNAARLALLRGADDCRLWSLSQLAVFSIKAAIDGSHVLPSPRLTS